MTLFHHVSAPTYPFVVGTFNQLSLGKTAPPKALFGDVRRVEVDEAIAAIAFGLEVHGQIEKVEPQLSTDVAILVNFSDVRYNRVYQPNDI
jgi:hypothetical protein